MEEPRVGKRRKLGNDAFEATGASIEAAVDWPCATEDPYGGKLCVARKETRGKRVKQLKGKKALYQPWTSRQPRRNPPPQVQHQQLQKLLGPKALSRVVGQKSRQGLGCPKPRCKSSDSARFTMKASVGDSINDMARRLVIGRTEPLLLQLMRNTMFEGNPSDGLSSDIPAAKGLFTTHLGEPCLIVNVFYRYTTQMVDLATLEQAPHKHDAEGRSLWVLRRRGRTCPAADIGPVGLHFTTSMFKGKQAFFIERARNENVATSFVHDVSRSRNVATTVPKVTPEGGTCVTFSTEPIVVTPDAAKQHSELYPGHRTTPRSSSKRPHFLLDVPLHRLLDLRTHRCTKKTCLIRGCRAFHTTDDDVRAVCPDVIIHSGSKIKKMYMTPRYLLQLLQFLYQSLNMRATRRLLLTVINAALLPLLMQGRVLNAELAVCPVLGVPSAEEIKSVAMKAFTHFVRRRVQIMRKRQLIYNMKIVRSDGNNDLASRVRPWSRGPDRYLREHTAIIGWCGTDGSLLQPVSLNPGEAFEDLAADAEPMLEDGRDAQLEVGIPLQDTIPVAHSSDSYGKHLKLWPKVYDRLWQGLRVNSCGVTPRGLAATIGVAGSTDRPASSLVTQCGEPRHEVIGHRRCVSTLTNDNRDVNVDHEDHVNRLSAELMPTKHQPDAQQVPNLESAKARELLRVCVQETVADLKRLVADDENAAAELKTFLASPSVREATIWRGEYKAPLGPPRGALARWARRLGTELHPSLGFWNYPHIKEFRTEGRRITRWYKRGRKLYRLQCGIKRKRAKPSEERGVPKPRIAMTKKLKAHYKRLKRQLREEGLWNWRSVALAMHLAMLPMQSGTVPVERLWACLQEFLPTAARRMSAQWFLFLADMMFMRFNYLHFNHQVLPAWTRDDSLMAAQMDTLLSIAKELQDGEGEHSPIILQAITEAYATEAGGAEQRCAVERSIGCNKDGRSDKPATASSASAAMPTIEEDAPRDAPACGTDEGQSVGFTRRGCHFAATPLNSPKPLIRKTVSAQPPAHIPPAMEVAPGKAEVFRRVLLPVWLSALLQGEKSVEVQRYRQHCLNSMAPIQAGHVLLIAEKGSRAVCALAVVSSQKGQGEVAIGQHLMQPWMHPAHYEAFKQYLQGYFSFEYIRFAAVYDLRPLGMDWSAFETLFSTTWTRQHQGFPALGTGTLRQQLMEWVKELGLEPVVCHF